MRYNPNANLTLEHMKKPTTYSKTLVFIITFLVFSCGLVAQTLNTPTPIRNPNFGGSGAGWTAACASASFNEYFVNFTWSANPNVNSDNTFVLELSDATGNFTNPIVLTTVTDRNNSNDFNIQFSLPTNTRGNGYKLRVKSTSPVLFSPETIAYNMYYINYRNPIRITENGSGIIGNGKIAICDGGTAVIAVDNVPNAETYQYIWRRSSTVLPDKGPSITVSQNGMYSVEIDYGNVCSGSAGTLSNLITVEGGTKLGIAINAPTTTAFCAGETAAPLEATINNSDLFYTWYKNNVEVSARTRGQFSYTIDTNLPDFNGDYTVKIEGDGICSETTAPVTITKTGGFTVTETNALDMVILPGQTKTLEVNTTASSPTYQWFRNGTAIAGATNNTYNTTQAGTYYVQVLQRGACAATTNSGTTTIVAPTSLELVTNYTTSYSDCDNSTILLDVNIINAVSSAGIRTDVTADLKDSLSYQWKKDGIDVPGATAATISLTQVTENGVYTLDASIASFLMTSNSLPVVLKSDEVVSITASDLTVCNNTETITVSTTNNLTGETFQWLRNGTVVNTTDTTLATSETGIYQLVISREGCPITSNEITINPFDASLISLDAPEDLVLVEGSSRTVTANGGTAYEWRDESNNVISNSSSVILTNEGTYILTAFIDACVVLKEITVSYRDTFRIPNVITVNGDGINDLWLLPNTYANQDDVRVIIQNTQGTELLNVTNYQNNWPQSSMTFPTQNMIFYYTLQKGNEVVKQGTITVIK